LSFGHSHKGTSPALCHLAFPPHFKHNLLRAYPKTQQVVILTVHPDMVELESPIGSQRRSLDFELKSFNSEVSWSCSVSIAHFKVVVAKKAAQKFLANFASVCVAQHPVANQWRVSPDVFWCLLSDNLNEKFNGVHA
jgi:hypothetical protein